LKHAMMVNLCQTLHFAPIGDNPQNILDMGTGTGIWAIDSEITLQPSIQ
jgi:methylase of polypeptide subunit release factors